MAFKVVCIKTCVSDKFHIVYEGQFYEVYKEIVKLNKGIFYTQYKSIFIWQEKEKEKEKFPYQIYELCDVGASEYSLGCFDKRNFLTLAEYRDCQINDILSDIKLLK